MPLMCTKKMPATAIMPTVSEGRADLPRFEDLEEVTLKGSPALGDLLMQRPLVEFLYETLGKRVNVAIKSGFMKPLFDNLGVPINFVDFDEAEQDPLTLDISQYLSELPHLQKRDNGNYAHLVDWAGYALGREISTKFRDGNEFLDGKLDSDSFFFDIGPEVSSKYHPTVNLTDDEREFGRKEIEALRHDSNGKRSIVIFPWASTKNKNWDDKQKCKDGVYGNWQDFFDAFGDDYHFVQLKGREDPSIAIVEKGRFSVREYVLREGLGVIAAANGAIVADTYGLHGAVFSIRERLMGNGNLGIVTILPSSNPVTVSYAGVTDVTPSHEVCVFHSRGYNGCSEHDYVDRETFSKKVLKITGDHVKFYKNHCIFDESTYPCVNAITVDTVGEALKDAVPAVTKN